MADLVPSLELISERVREERSQLREHADSIDSKAGLALGISGVLATVPDATAAFAVVGRIVAAIAATLCVAALFPRPFAALHLRELRSQYLTQPELFTRLDALDTDIEMHQRDATLLQRKVRLLKVALLSLALAIVPFVAGIITT